MNIKTRVVILRAAADLSKRSAAAKMYRETADVLEAMAAQFNTLAGTVLDAYARRNEDPEDPAWNMIHEVLERQGLLKARKNGDAVERVPTSAGGGQ